LDKITSILEDVVEIFRKEPPLINVAFTDSLVVGDTHGDVDSSTNALKLADRLGSAAIFLGDYVDRGPYQLENLINLFERKISSPTTTILLRGNHETLTMNTYYGFLDVVVRKHSLKTYKAILKAFTEMPYALLISNKVLCVHGGLPKGLDNVNQISLLPKGEEDVTHPIAMQLLWNDPRDELEEFAESDRGGGALYFGEKVFTEFMSKNSLNLMVRSHEPYPNGYRYIFNNKLLTIFSCRYYSIPPKAAHIREDSIEILDIGDI